MKKDASTMRKGTDGRQQTSSLPSLFKGFFEKESVPVEWRQVYNWVTGDALRKQTERYRATKDGKYKSSLLSLMPACSTNGRGKGAADLTGLTSVSMADFDHLPPSRLEVARALVNADPHTLFCYVTVSGEGLRVLFRYEAEAGSGASAACEAGASAACEAGVSASCEAGMPAACEAGTSVACEAGTSAACEAGMPAACEAGASAACEAEASGNETEFPTRDNASCKAEAGSDAATGLGDSPCHEPFPGEDGLSKREDGLLPRGESSSPFEESLSLHVEGLSPEEMRLYEQAFLWGNCYYADLIGHDFDEKCSNVNRLSALCYDMSAFFNEKAVPFVIPEEKALDSDFSEELETQLQEGVNSGKKGVKSDNEGEILGNEETNGNGQGVKTGKEGGISGTYGEETNFLPNGVSASDTDGIFTVSGVKKLSFPQGVKTDKKGVISGIYEEESDSLPSRTLASDSDETSASDSNEKPTFDSNGVPASDVNGMLASDSNEMPASDSNRELTSYSNETSTSDSNGIPISDANGALSSDSNGTPASHEDGSSLVSDAEEPFLPQGVKTDKKGVNSGIYEEESDSLPSRTLASDSNAALTSDSNGTLASHEDGSSLVSDAEEPFLPQGVKTDKKGVISGIYGEETDSLPSRTLASDSDEKPTSDANREATSDSNGASTSDVNREPISNANGMPASNSNRPPTSYEDEYFTIPREEAPSSPQGVKTGKEGVISGTKKGVNAGKTGRGQGVEVPVSLTAYAAASIEKHGDYYVTGNRNQYLMKCLMRMNRLGVAQAEAEDWALSHDLGDAEIRRIVRSCYSHTAEHGIYEAPSGRGRQPFYASRPSGWEAYGTPARGNGGFPGEAYRYGSSEANWAEAGCGKGEVCDNCDIVTVDGFSTHTRAREEEPAGQVSFPLPPSLPACPWPRFLQQMVDCGETVAQRDALLLAALTVMGASLNKLLRSLYGRQYVYPCLQTFVVAPPASGKGALTWVRKLVEPLHDRMMASYQQGMEAYRKEKAAYDAAGRAKVDKAEPEQPMLKMFLIAGNNSATGILENLMNAGGVGLICESEADTVSAALGSDYGHWSDTLRKAFDHDRMAYNRRTNREYREIPHTYLSVLLSGTPAQVKPLIPSSENGLFSRQIFYAMPGATEWISQFDRVDGDMNERFGRWGKEWMELLERVKQHLGVITFSLSEGQKARFDETFGNLFTVAGNALQGSMKSSVARLAVNLLRMMSVVAFLRAQESSGLLFPDSDLPAENIVDGTAARFTLALTDDDFESVLSLARPLHLHAAYVLSLLPEVEASNRKVPTSDALLTLLGSRFTSAEAQEAGRTLGVSDSTVRQWLTRMAANGTLEKESRGIYIITRTCV